MPHLHQGVPVESGALEEVHQFADVVDTAAMRCNATAVSGEQRPADSAPGLGKVGLAHDEPALA